MPGILYVPKVYKMDPVAPPEGWTAPMTAPLESEMVPAGKQSEDASDQTPSPIPHSVMEHMRVLGNALTKIGITDPTARRILIGSMAYETDNFQAMDEYASGKDYANRKNLGNTEEDDGKKYKGRGYVQLTGKGNYKYMSDKLGYDLVNHPELAARPDIALEIAIQKIKSTSQIQRGIKSGSFGDITEGINGGFNGVGQRLQFYQKFLDSKYDEIMNPTGTKEATQINLNSVPMHWFDSTDDSANWRIKAKWEWDHRIAQYKAFVTAANTLGLTMPKRRAYLGTHRELPKISKNGGTIPQINENTNTVINQEVMNKDYLSAYGTQGVRRFQQGGEMGGAPAGGAPAGGDPQQMLMEYAETRDPQLAVAICDALVEMMAAQQGAEAGAEAGAAEGAAAAAPPAARNGGQMPQKFRNGGQMRNINRGPVFNR